MKSFAWAICTAILLMHFGCRQDEEPDLFLEGEWVLVESIVPPRQGQPPADELPFEESYVFSRERTFSKNRLEEGGLTVATGTYTINPAAANTSGVVQDLVLTFETGVELVGDCNHGNTENLVLMESDRLENTWHYCDGPHYIYSRE